MKKLFTLLALFVSVFALFLTGNINKKAEAAGAQQWSVIGKTNSSNWDKDFNFTWDATDNRYELIIALAANDEFKMRLPNWSGEIGAGGSLFNTTYFGTGSNGSNIKVIKAGTYLLWIKDDNVQSYGDKSYGWGVEQCFTVTSYKKDGSVLKTETVAKNHKYVTLFHEEEGYSLEGWYTNANLTTKFAENTAITSNTKLYPKYVVSNDYQVYLKDASNVFGSTVYAYLYRENGSQDVAWPGTKITKNQDGFYVVSVDASKSYTSIIFSGSSKQTVDLTLKGVQDKDTYVLGQKNSNGKYEATLENTSVRNNLKELLTQFYNDGTYKKETAINLTEAASNELLINGGWHAKANELERTTYYDVDSLWMSRGPESDGKGYSFYGSAANNGGVTNAYAAVAGEKPADAKVVLSGEGKNSMNEYYSGLEDILATVEEWTKSGDVYTTANKDVLELFKAFVAPCYLGFNTTTGNYITFTSATIQKVNGQLVLQLHATGDSAKIVNGTTVFAQATISTWKNN